MDARPKICSFSPWRDPHEDEKYSFDFTLQFSTSNFDLLLRWHVLSLDSRWEIDEVCFWLFHYSKREREDRYVSFFLYANTFNISSFLKLSNLHNHLNTKLLCLQLRKTLEKPKNNPRGLWFSMGEFKVVFCVETD